MIQILSFFHKRKKTLRWALYLGSIYLGLGLVGYGLAWKSFKLASMQVLTNGGRQVSGKIVSLRSSGIGQNKDFYVKVESSLEEFMIPASLVNPYWEKNIPRVDLGRFLSEGKVIVIASSGGDQPAVLGLTLLEPGQPDQKLLDYNASAIRYQQTAVRAEEIGAKYVWFGILLFPLTWVLSLLVQFGFKKLLVIRPELFVKYGFLSKN